MESHFAQQRRRDADRLRTAALAVVIVGCLVRAGVQGPMRRPAPQRIDPQHAPAWTLTLLPGVGPRRAAHILRARAGRTVRSRRDVAAAARLGVAATERLVRSRAFRLPQEGQPP